MVVRNTHRFEVRLDEERWRVLQEELAARHVTFAAWIREQVDETAKQQERARRLEAVERLTAMGEKCPIDWGTPEELKQELSHASCPGAEFCGASEYH